MKKPLLLAMSAIAAASYAQAAVPVDFDKIEQWTGEGTNRAALVICNDAGASDPRAYVWGYRWPDGETRTGEDMFKAVCANSDELVLLTQRTGVYGATVCGIGFGDAARLLADIYFDFDMARDFEFINFDYYNASPLFGQKDAPGDDTPRICADAIDEAISSGKHYIQHPLDYQAYGYPAYDYDCWKLADGDSANGWWSSAWYCGYWSYWTAQTGGDEWMYSGSGFSGRQLADGSVDGWSYTMFDSPQVGGVGEGTPPPDDEMIYSYRPCRTNSGVAAATDNGDIQTTYYSLTGVCLGNVRPSAGIYIVKRGDIIRKVVIR